jgi:hypothetical protein
MTIMQLAGFPAEVVDSVVSVLCRMAFDFGLWSDGVSPLLFVCEEAHRYASADRNIGFGPTRKAVSRIAKEGRKYGVYLGLVTQRPAELDATIISQCNTLFAMRLANDRDQALLRSAVSDAAANLLSFVPSLGTREVLAFGEGVALPTRLRFKEDHHRQPLRGARDAGVEPALAALGKCERLVEQHHVVPLRALRLVHGEHIAVVELVVRLRSANRAARSPVKHSGRTERPSRPCRRSLRPASAAASRICAASSAALHHSTARR